MMYGEGRWLDLRDPALAADPDLQRARGMLEGYAPADGAQQELRRRIVEWIDRHPEDAHRRSCLEGHLTASALVLGPEGRRVLLLHHRKLGRWLQPGGHCDGDANLPAVALRECVEESGIESLRIAARVVDVDIHTIPERPGEPAHLHLDTRFLVLAAAGSTEPRANHEANELRWFTLEQALEVCDDASLERLLRWARERRPALLQ